MESSWPARRLGRATKREPQSALGHDHLELKPGLLRGRFRHSLHLGPWLDHSPALGPCDSQDASWTGSAHTLSYTYRKMLVRDQWSLVSWGLADLTIKQWCAMSRLLDESQGRGLLLLCGPFGSFFVVIVCDYRLQILWGRICPIHSCDFDITNWVTASVCEY